MPADRETLNVHISLTWVKAIAAVVGIGVTVGGPILYGCLEMRDAVREQRRTSRLVEKHIDRVASDFKESARERLEFEKRITRLEAHSGVGG